MDGERSGSIVDWDIGAPEPWTPADGPYAGGGAVLLEATRPGQPDGAPEAGLRVELLVGGASLDELDAGLGKPARGAGRLLKREAFRICLPAGPALLVDMVVQRRFFGRPVQLLTYVIAPEGTGDRLALEFTIAVPDGDAGIEHVHALALESRDVAESVRVTLGDPDKHPPDGPAPS